MNQLNSSSSRRALSNMAWCRLNAVSAAAVALAAFTMPSAQALVLDTGTLNINATGILDLKRNNLIIRSGSIVTLTGYVTTGLYGVTTWGGFGINSSAAANDPLGETAVGILDNSVAQYTSWPPLEPVSGIPLTAILAKFTTWGDGDLNGTTNEDDFTLFLGGFNNDPGSTGWLFGDYDYNGDVDTDDFTLFLTGFNSAQDPLVPAFASPVPEPGSIVLLSASLLGGFAFRRNRRSCN